MATRAATTNDDHHASLNGRQDAEGDDERRRTGRRVTCVSREHPDTRQRNLERGGRSETERGR
jgi:hypothetical protein